MFTPGSTTAPRQLVRDGSIADWSACAALDTSYDTEYAWQLDHDENSGVYTASFRPIRLPRSIRIVPPRNITEPDILSDPETGLFLVAEPGTSITGYIIVRFDQIHETAWIIDCTVARSQRRQGIGTSLYREAYARCRDAGLRRITAETQSRNYPSISFYQRIGLVFCGYNDRYYPNYDIALFFGAMIHS